MNGALFLPLALAIGLAGTRTWLQARHSLHVGREGALWLLPVLAWLPLVCWILSWFVPQD